MVCPQTASPIPPRILFGLFWTSGPRGVSLSPRQECTGLPGPEFGLDKSPKQNSAQPDLRGEKCKCSRGKGVQRSRETCYLTSKLSLVDPCVLILPWRYWWPLKISRCSYHGPLRWDGEGSAIPIPSGFLKPLGSVNQSRLYLKPKPLWFPSDARPPRLKS